MSNILKIILSAALLFSIVIYANMDEKSTSDIREMRGKIVTDDNVTVAATQKIYKLTFFGTPYNKEQMKSLLTKINKKVPINIQSALQRYFKDRNEKYKIVLYGLTKDDVVKIQNILDSSRSKGFSFVPGGERRVYPYGDFLTPVLGYNKKQIDTATNFTYLEGVTGVEKEYNNLLADTPLVRATDIHLSINFQRQKSLEKELTELKALYDAKEIISVVLDDTFRIKAFASSNRYVPNDIHRKDFSNLDIHALQYLFRADAFKQLEDIKSSGIDLPYERAYNNKINFIQLIKAYSPFFMGGYIGNPKVVKTQSTDKKQIDTATNFTYLEGVTGVEKEYNTLLSDTPLVRAKDLHLSINFQRQKKLEQEVYELKALYDAREVVSVVLDDTFHIKAFASSNRYIANDIHRKDFANLDVHAIGYLFKLNEFGFLVGDALYFNAKNPKFQIYADLELNQPSGIDLPYERFYNNEDRDFKNYKVNFIQLVKAYSPFYLGGYIGNPKVVKTQSTDKKQIISQELAESLKKKADIFFGTMPGRRVTLEFEDNNISADIYMRGFTKNNHKYMQVYFTIYNQEEMPFDVVVKSEASSSNQYLEATIYSKKDNHKIGKVIQPINKYQANRRKGSEREIVGIYKADDGNYYIDAVTTKETPTASCNACQEYNVETLEITDDGIISVNIRPFDIETYKQMY